MFYHGEDESPLKVSMSGRGQFRSFVTESSGLSRLRQRMATVEGRRRKVELFYRPIWSNIIRRVGETDFYAKIFWVPYQNGIFAVVRFGG